MTDLNQRFGVVTGASSGIGLELAKQFAQNGFDLLLVAEDAGITQAAQSIVLLGGKAEAVQIDLAKPEGVEKLYAQITSAGRPLDAIAINAGIGAGGDFARETSLEQNLAIVDLNVRSVVHLTKRVLEDMVARNEGRILITSSIAATMPGPLEAVYAASKAFERSFVFALRGELEETNVTVTALMPGPTDTNFFHRAGMDDTKVGQGKKDDPAEVARQGFEAMMEGVDQVIAGSLKNKMQAVAAKILPAETTAAMHKDMAKPKKSA